MAQASPDKIVEKAEESLKPLMEQVGKAAESLTSEFEGIPKLIKKYPVQAVLIGFGVGIATAMLLRKASE